LQDAINLDQLPSLSSEMTETEEIESLEEHFRKLKNDIDAPLSHSPSVGIPLHRSSSNSSQSSSSSDIRPIEQTSSITSSVRELHDNLERRLMPFWSLVLSHRTVRISLYASEDAASMAQALGGEAHDCDGPKLSPIASGEVTTAHDGLFQTTFVVRWDVLSKHPDGARVSSGDMTTEHDFFVLAELLPPPPSPDSAVSQSAPANDAPVAKVQIKVPLSYSPVRVISDIDDTVKTANILAGLRAAFRTVFTQNLVELVIPGVGNWYDKMWQRGARFHYVVRSFVIRSIGLTVTLSPVQWAIRDPPHTQ
jgi:phosphatidate phosphatase APP1